MANYYGKARTNYVKIKDFAGFRQAIEPFDVELITDSEGKCGLLSKADDGWPTDAYDWETDTGDDIDFNLGAVVCPFMEDDQILVAMEVGSEKLAFLAGVAVAYNAQGGKATINLNDIYSSAAIQFGVSFESINKAEG